MSKSPRPLIDWVPEGGLLNADSILDRFTRWASDSGLELYDAQEEALLELMTNRHVVLSTPTGSTAYSMSGGGPIMNPALDAIVLVPMFSHSLTSRPIVVHGDSEICLGVVSRNQINPVVTCEGQVSLKALPGDSVLVRKKKERLTLLHPPGHSFYASCRDKLRWSDALTQ